MIQRRLRPALSALLLCLVALYGCPNDPVDNQAQLDAGEPDVIEEPDVEEEISCNPGEIVACAGEEQSGILVCNADGDGTNAGECPGVSVCRDEECVQVNCRPGTGICDGQQPLRCVPDGEGDYEFQPQESCGDGETCEAGVCLDRCGLAELIDSYVGCEYWAVETENVLLYQDSQGNPAVPAANRPPFAVVLVNDETDVTAQVSIYGPDGELAEAISSREVHSYRQNPGEEWVTVHSETVNEAGQRIAGPHSGPIDRIALPPNATLTLILPNQDIPFGESTVTSTAYRVVSTQPVVAYQFNPLCCNYNYTNDASLLMPTSALTENYMFMSHAVWAGGATNRLPDPRSPTITVVAMEDNTEVEIRLNGTVNDNQGYSDIIYPVRSADGIEGPDSSGVMRATLNAHQVLNVAGAGTSPVVDLTGSLITASKPVSVFGAHTCTNIPFTSAACDHLESQLFPLETWATNFIASPLKIRNPDPPPGSREGTYWKFLARENNTSITVTTSIAPSDVLPPSGEGVPRCSEFSASPADGEFTLNAGQSCEFGTRHPFRAQSSRPIMIGAFMSGQNTVFDQVDWGDHAGDPSFFLLPPEEQYRTSYTFLTPATYFVSYITITMRTGFDIVLDGEVLDPTDFDHEILDGGTHIMAHIEVEPGPHQISSNIPFGLIVYGYDNYVSYAYTGGLDLTKLNPL